MVEAVVEYDYTAQEVDELTIHKGDVLTDILMQPGGWWEGSLNGRRGVFPDNFVKVQSKAKENLEIRDNMANSDVELRTNSGRKCRVLFSYQPVNDDELELQLNDIVDILDEVEEGWWKGRLKNRVGVFPSNFVTEITDVQTNGGTSSRKTSATQPPTIAMLKKEENIGVTVGETDSPASPTGPDSGNPNAVDVNSDAPSLPPKPVKELCRVMFPYDAQNEDELTLKEGDVLTIITKELPDKGWWKGELSGRVGVFPDNFVTIIPREEATTSRPPAKVSAPPSSSNRTAPDKEIKPPNAAVAVVAANKKQNIPKPEEPEDKIPPVLTKKPALPPTAKKPQFRPTAPNPAPHTPNVSVIKNKKVERPAGRTEHHNDHDDHDGISSSRMVTISGDADFDGVERGAMLKHPTRAKAPRRRPPTGMIKNDIEPSGGMLNGNSEHHEQPTENHHHAQNHATADQDSGSTNNSSGGPATNRNSKEWEKHKAPWMEELKMSQAAKKGVKASPPPPSLRDPGFAKSDVLESPASPTATEPPKNNSIPYRQNAANNNSVTNNNGTVTSPFGARPQSVHGDVVPNRYSSSPGARPLSMYSPAATDKSSPASSPAPAPSPGGSNNMVSMKHISEITEKVSKLEIHCEFLLRQVSDLTNQVREEREKREQIAQELEKLADLVTQV